MSRVSYYQNVFDLLGVEMRVVPDAISGFPARPDAWAMIQGIPFRTRTRNPTRRQVWESVPERVREWVSIIGMVPTSDREADRIPSATSAVGYLWSDYSAGHLPCSVHHLLAQLEGNASPPLRPPAGHLCILFDADHTGRWAVRLDPVADPPVVRLSQQWGVPRARDEAPFTDFVFGWIVRHYLLPSTPRSGQPGYRGQQGPWSLQPKRHLNGLWLRCPRAAAALPPHLDQLIDHFDERPRVARRNGPTTYTFATTDAELRVTTDDWAVADGHSAWWLSGTTEAGLADLARRVCDVVDLTADLRADTAPGRQVLDWLRRG